MRFVDDVLPAAKPVHLGVPAVKGRQGDSESGTAFRKAFAALGTASEPAAKTPETRESGKPAAAEDADPAGDSPAKRNPAKTETRPLPRLHLSENVTEQASRTTLPPAEEPAETPRDALSTKPNIRMAAKDAAGASPDRAKPDLPAETRDPSAPGSTVDDEGTVTEKKTAEVSADPAPHAEDASIPRDVRNLRLSRHSGIEFANSATRMTTGSPARANDLPAGMSATAALKASLARKAVMPGASEKQEDADVLPKAGQNARDAPSTSADKSSAKTPAASGNAGAPATPVEITAKASLVRAGRLSLASDGVAAAPDGRTGSVAAVKSPAHAERQGGIAALPETVKTPLARNTVPAGDLSEKVSPAHAGATARSGVQAALPLAPASRQAPVEPSSDDVEGADPAAQPEAGSDMRQLLALLGLASSSPLAVTRVADGTAGTAGDLGALAERARGDAPAAAATRPSSAADAPLAVDRKDGPDQLFRFARADGKGGTVSMTVGTDSQKTVSVAADANAARGETVTVLDARRYLGIAPSLPAAMPASANAQAVTSAIAGSAPLTPALDPNAASLTGQPAGAAGKVVNTLKIQMHPIDLGLVTATLRLKDDELQVELKVQSGEAYRQLTDDQDSMIKALRAQGFAVDQMNIVFTPAPDNVAPRDSFQQAPGGQQQPAQGGRDGQAGLGADGGREQRNGGSGERNAGDRRAWNDGTRETSSVPQSGGSDDLYL